MDLGHFFVVLLLLAILINGLSFCQTQRLICCPGLQRLLYRANSIYIFLLDCLLSGKSFVGPYWLYCSLLVVFGCCYFIEDWFVQKRFVVGLFISFNELIRITRRILIFLKKVIILIKIWQLFNLLHIILWNLVFASQNLPLLNLIRRNLILHQLFNLFLFLNLILKSSGIKISKLYISVLLFIYTVDILCFL